METRNDQPPSQTLLPMAEPPHSDVPTTAQLRGDIDSGRTGDKIALFDPGLSPLGTDDEAAGTPAEPHRIRLARRMEGVRRWATGNRRAGSAHGPAGRVEYAYAAGAGLIGLVMALGIVLGRS